MFTIYFDIYISFHTKNSFYLTFSKAHYKNLIFLIKKKEKKLMCTYVHQNICNIPSKNVQHKRLMCALMSFKSCLKL